MRILNFVSKLALAITLDLLLLTYAAMGYGMYVTRDTHKVSNETVRAIYKKIVAATGQTQDTLPLSIVESPIVNAYNDGHKVVIYRGLLDFVQNEDEIALILGHEVAHGTLRHVYFQEFRHDSLEVAVAEGNADKLGAVYIIKAGYDVCKAREMWKRMLQQEGNALGQDHPDYSYRYSELNIGCEK